MVIKLDILAKQGLLVAVLSIAELILLLIDGIWRMVYYYQKKTSYMITEAYEEDYDEIDMYRTGENGYLKQLAEEATLERCVEIGSIVFYIVGIFLSALMILGILKKYKNLIAPWIVVYGLCAIAAVCYLIYSVIAVAPTTTNIVRVVETFNIACLALYPVVMLFMQLHREAAETKKLQSETEFQVENVNIHPKFNPYFVETPVKEIETEL